MSREEDIPVIEDDHDEEWEDLPDERETAIDQSKMAAKGKVKIAYRFKVI